jgi:hypothetical protein
MTCYNSLIHKTKIATIWRKKKASIDEYASKKVKSTRIHLILCEISNNLTIFLYFYKTLIW